MALILGFDAWAVPAAPNVVTLTQPDGFTFEAMQKGDEYASWMVTLDGISIVLAGGEWFYAIQDAAGDLISSGSSVGSLAQAELAQWPLGLSPYVDPDTREKHYPMRYRESADPSRALTHTQKVLTILVHYTDISFTYLDPSFQSLIYGVSASVKDFFSDNSYASFTVSPAAETSGTLNDGIVHISRPIAHPDLGGGDWTAEASAIVSAVDPSVDFSSFDTNADGTISARELSIVIILAGYEASVAGASSPNVWGHKFSFSTITLDGKGLSPYTMFGERHQTHQATIGIMCHELGHLMLGLPDLYDTTPQGDADSEGIGEWGLMGNGSWNKTGSFFGD